MFNPTLYLIFIILSCRRREMLGIILNEIFS